MSKEGKLIIFSGFSGAGKGTVMKGLLDKYPDDFCLSISATTRAPRNGEQEGISYFFKTQEEFKKMIAEDAFLEYAEYVENYYGTPKEFVFNKLDEGKNVILEIEMQGAMKVKNKYPDTMLLFLLPPSIDILSDRLVNRGTDDSDTIRKRLFQAKKEAAKMDTYEYFIINDNLEECIEDVYNLAHGHEAKNHADKQFLNEIREGLDRFLKGEI